MNRFNCKLNGYRGTDYKSAPTGLQISAYGDYKPNYAEDGTTIISVSFDVVTYGGKARITVDPISFQYLMWSVYGSKTNDGNSTPADDTNQKN